MSATLTGQLFTAVNIGGVTIATSAIIVVTNTLYTLLKLSPKWTAFATALIIAYLNVIFSSDPQWYDWGLAFLNACMLFCSALGLNEIVVASKKTSEKEVAGPSGFFKTWLQKR
jgi:zinc transporter ZupT